MAMLRVLPLVRPPVFTAGVHASVGLALPRSALVSIQCACVSVPTPSWRVVSSASFHASRQLQGRYPGGYRAPHIEDRFDEGRETSGPEDVWSTAMLGDTTVPESNPDEEDLTLRKRPDFLKLRKRARSLDRAQRRDGPMKRNIWKILMEREPEDQENIKAFLATFGMEEYAEKFTCVEMLLEMPVREMRHKLKIPCKARKLIKRHRHVLKMRLKLREMRQQYLYQKALGVKQYDGSTPLPELEDPDLYAHKVSPLSRVSGLQLIGADKELQNAPNHREAVMNRLAEHDPEAKEEFLRDDIPWTYPIALATALVRPSAKYNFPRPIDKIWLDTERELYPRMAVPEDIVYDQQDIWDLHAKAYKYRKMKTGKRKKLKPWEVIRRMEAGTL